MYLGAQIAMGNLLINSFLFVVYLTAQCEPKGKGQSGSNVFGFRAHTGECQWYLVVVVSLVILALIRIYVSFALALSRPLA